jgi:hypothetical protein
LDSVWLPAPGSRDLVPRLPCPLEIALEHGQPRAFLSRRAEEVGRGEGEHEAAGRRLQKSGCTIEPDPLAVGESAIEVGAAKQQHFLRSGAHAVVPLHAGG